MAGLLCAACAPGKEDEAKHQALEVATTFVRAKGLVGGNGYTARIHDDGDAWPVSYRGPPDHTGGAPTVLPDKETLMVVGHYAGGQ